MDREKQKGEVQAPGCTWRFRMPQPVSTSSSIRICVTISTAIAILMSIRIAPIVRPVPFFLLNPPAHRYISLVLLIL